jgi:hypothetical protein
MGRVDQPKLAVEVAAFFDPVAGSLSQQTHANPRDGTGTIRQACTLKVPPYDHP